MLNTTPPSSTIDTASTTCTALILLPSRQRPARTRSLPARINLPSQALASISEEHSDAHNYNDKQGVVELRSRIQRPGAKKFEYLESPNPETQFKLKSTSGPFPGADSDSTTTISTGTVQPRLLLQWSKSDPSPLTRNQLGDNTSTNSNPKNKAKLRIRTRTSSSSLSSRFNFDRDCGICFDPAVRPSRTKCCGKVFCEEHLHDWLNGSSNRCPACASECHPQTGTISLAPPMTPTIHNVPMGLVSTHALARTTRTPPTPRTPHSPPTPRSPPSPLSQPLPVHAPAPIRPSLTYFANLTNLKSPISTNSDSLDPALDSSSDTNCGPGALIHTPGNRLPEISSGPSSPRSATLLLMLNAVSQSLTQKIARGLARRDTNQDLGYDSATVNPNAEVGLPPALSRSSSPESSSSSPSSPWSPSSYFKFDFDFGPDPSYPSDLPTRSESPFPLFPPTRLGELSCAEHERMVDQDALVRGLSDLGSKMLGRVLSMVGMVLVLSVLFVGRTRSGSFGGFDSDGLDGLF
ncbi:hypothetical protein C8J55DRAFT_495267 [Lentinula edodes]|uniref:RING-type domain-containing protein n=1 Tax=Lentinula lateritia TaxID=40482 RepID=A0A9W9E167_9AGAR|nr:hypothetical protein C8J55DRAFT_495267 [Lentinula edodes]